MHARFFLTHDDIARNNAVSFHDIVSSVDQLMCSESCGTSLFRVANELTKLVGVLVFLFYFENLEAPNFHSSQLL